MVILTGAGRAFCAGYDLSEFAARAEDPHTQEMPWDPTVDYRMMNKMMVNQPLESMGLAGTQMLATLFDGIARHSPEGLWFKRRAEQVGFAQAVRERDSGDPIAPDVSR